LEKNCFATNYLSIIAAGVLILLGLLIAFVNSITQLISNTANDESEELFPIKRARVTGRLSKE